MEKNGKEWSRTEQNRSSCLRHWRFFHSSPPLSTINAFFQMHALSLTYVKHKSKPYGVNGWAWQSKISRRPQDRNLIMAWWLLCKRFKFIFYSYPNDWGRWMESRMLMFLSLGRRWLYPRPFSVYMFCCLIYGWLSSPTALAQTPVKPSISSPLTGWNHSWLKEQPLEVWGN